MLMRINEYSKMKYGSLKYYYVTLRTIYIFFGVPTGNGSTRNVEILV